MKKIHPDKWWLYLLLAIVSGVLFCAVFVRAIDTGSLLQYTVAIVLLIITLKELFNFIRKLIKK